MKCDVILKLMSRFVGVAVSSLLVLSCSIKDVPVNRIVLKKDAQERSSLKSIDYWIYSENGTLLLSGRETNEKREDFILDLPETYDQKTCRVYVWGNLPENFISEGQLLPDVSIPLGQDLDSLFSVYKEIHFEDGFFMDQMGMERRFCRLEIELSGLTAGLKNVKAIVTSGTDGYTLDGTPKPGPFHYETMGTMRDTGSLLFPVGIPLQCALSELRLQLVTQDGEEKNEILDYPLGWNIRFHGANPSDLSLIHVHVDLQQLVLSVRIGEWTYVDDDLFL